MLALIKSTSVVLKRTGLALVMLSPTALVSADLMAPFTLESTQTLPSGVRNPRFLNVLVSVDTKFNSEGGNEPLGQRLNKAITWNDVIEARSDETDRNLIRAIISNEKYNLDANGSPGNATGKVYSYVNVKVPVLAVGITPTFTLAALVPIVSADVSVDTGYTASAEGKRFVDAICETSPEKCNEAAEKLNNATREKLARLGYEPLKSQVFSGVGDVQLVGKNLWYTDPSQGFATKLGLTLPTGRTANPDRALDVPTGDGRVKAGLTFIYDRALIEQSRWVAYTGYSILFGHNTVKRLPVSDTDSLSKDKEQLRRNTGEQATVGTTVDYKFDTLGLTLTTGYSLQYQSKSRYSAQDANRSPDEGTKRRYLLLENLEPAQLMHAVLLAGGFSTVDWYRKKSFPLPLQLNVNYSRPIAGRNAPTSSVIAGEMVVFF